VELGSPISVLLIARNVNGNRRDAENAELRRDLVFLSVRCLSSKKVVCSYGSSETIYGAVHCGELTTTGFTEVTRLRRRALTELRYSDLNPIRFAVTGQQTEDRIEVNLLLVIP